MQGTSSSPTPESIDLGRRDALKVGGALVIGGVGEKGMYAGKIKSIIPPRLASHVRREAGRFVDEIKRAT